eukprot:403366860
MSLFGQPQAQPTSSLFGGASLNNSNSTQSNQFKPAGSSLFGGQPSTQPQQQPQSTILFGQNSVSQSQHSFFGSAATSQNQTKIDSSSSVQQQQPSFQAQSNQVSSATTQSTNQQPQLFGLGENSNSGNPFGNSATNNQATVSAQSNTSRTLGSTTSASLFSNSFPQPQQQQTVQQNTGFSIGQQTTQSATTFGNLNAQPTTTTNTGLFGSNASNNNTATVPSGSLFGGAAVNNNNVHGLFGNANNNTGTSFGNQLGQITSDSSVNSGGLFGAQGGLFGAANTNASFAQGIQALNLFSNLNQENSSLNLFQIEIKNLECLLQNSQINPYFPNNVSNGNQSAKQIHITLKLLDPNNAGVVQHQVTQSIFPQFLANTDLIIDGTQIQQSASGGGIFSARPLPTDPPALKLDVKLRQQSNVSSLFGNTAYHNLVTSQVGLRIPQQQQQQQILPRGQNVFSHNPGYNFSNNSNGFGGNSNNNANYPLGQTERNTTIVREQDQFSREGRLFEFHSNPENKKSKEQQRFEDYLKNKVEQKEDRLKPSNTEESKTSVLQNQPETQTLPKVNSLKNSSDSLKTQDKKDTDMITVHRPAPASQNKPLTTLTSSNQTISQQPQLSNTISSSLQQKPQVQEQQQPQVQEQKQPQVQQQQQPQVQQQQQLLVQQQQQPKVQEQKPAVQEEKKNEKKVEFNFNALNQNPTQSQQQNQQPTANAQTQQKKPMPLFGGAFDPTKQKSSSSVSSLFGNSQEEQKSSQSASQLFGQAHNPFAQISTRNVSLQPEVTTNANPFTNANKNSEGSDAPQSTGAGGFFVSAAPSQNVQGQNPAPTIQSNQAASSIFKPGATNIFGGMKK